MNSNAVSSIPYFFLWIDTTEQKISHIVCAHTEHRDHLLDSSACLEKT